MECPLCGGQRACVECDGLGEVPCTLCDGLGDGCEQCHGTGRYVCAPCDGKGLCARCKGEGEIEISDSRSAYPYFR